MSGLYEQVSGFTSNAAIALLIVMTVGCLLIGKGLASLNREADETAARIHARLRAERDQAGQIRPSRFRVVQTPGGPPYDHGKER